MLENYRELASRVVLSSGGDYSIVMFDDTQRTIHMHILSAVYFPIMFSRESRPGVADKKHRSCLCVCCEGLWSRGGGGGYLTALAVGGDC
jgi:hypothetical protein